MDNRPRHPQYRLYIDEAGDHAYYRPPDDPWHLYLGLLGVWFRLKDDYVQFADGLDRFKREIFGPRPDDPVILHREDILNTRGPFEILTDAQVRDRFNDGLLQLFRPTPFVLIIVVIDKFEHVQRYQHPDHPYHFCLGAMLDRYCGWLKHNRAEGDVVAEARGRKEDRLLAEEFTRVYLNGTYMFPRPEEHHQPTLTTKEIKLRMKRDNVAGLQLADLLAHPVRQAFLRERGVLPPGRDTFGDILCAAVEGKYNMNYRTGQVAGYGKVWLPVRK